MKERWLKIPKFIDYEVSSLGRVRSVARKGIDGRSLQSRILSVRPYRKDGRPRVCLYRKGHRSWHLVYRLVLYAFRGPCPRGKEARHFPDRKPSNCKLENLRWGTRTENSRDMVYHGTVNPNRTKDGRFTTYKRKRRTDYRTLRQ